QRICHITGNMEFTFCQLRQDMLSGNLSQLLQGSCPFPDLFSVFIQKIISQSLKHSHSAVIGSTSPDSHNKPAAALTYGIFDYLSHSISGSLQRIQSLPGSQS